jgi:hypothetical protein
MMTKVNLYILHIFTLAATVFYVFSNSYNLFDIIYNVWFYWSLFAFILAFVAYNSKVTFNSSTNSKFESIHWKFFNKEKDFILNIASIKFFIHLAETKKLIEESYKKNQHLHLYADIFYYVATIGLTLYGGFYFFAIIWVLKSIFDFKMRYDSNKSLKTIVV